VTIATNKIAEKLKSEKWMITPSGFSALVDSVNLAQTRPDLQLTAEKTEDEFQVEGATQSETGNTAVILVSGKIMKMGGDPERGEMLAWFGLCDLDCVDSALNTALSDDSVSDILMVFNSPGGESTGIPELGEKISSSTKPIYAWSETQCCSAAYWLASQCNIVGMSPSASVGSIGVYSVVMDMTSMMEKNGVKAEAISAGKFKLIGADFRTMTAEERGILQAGVDGLHKQFKSAVTGKRAVLPDAMEGLTYEGSAALENNLVDVVVNDASTFLQMTESENMKNLFRILKPAAATISAGKVAKLAEEPEKKDLDKKADVPGVPGTKSDDKKPEAKAEADGEEMEEGGYGKGYVACPYCKHNIDAGYLSDALDAQEEPEKKEDDKKPEKKADEPEKKSETPEKKDLEKEAAATKIVHLNSRSHQTVVMTPESRAEAKALLAGGDWKKAAGTFIKPSSNPFRDACNRNLEEIQQAIAQK